MDNVIGRILDDGTVEKEYFKQGMIYKNYDNFYAKSGICYISEYGTDNINTNNDYETYDTILQQVKDAYKKYNIDETKYSIEKMSETVFEMVDWQYFSTLLYEVIDSLDDECFKEER